MDELLKTVKEIMRKPLDLAEEKVDEILKEAYEKASIPYESIPLEKKNG